MFIYFPESIREGRVEKGERVRGRVHINELQNTMGWPSKNSRMALCVEAHLELHL